MSIMYVRSIGQVVGMLSAAVVHAATTLLPTGRSTQR
jgi:hypothetical protein